MAHETVETALPNEASSGAVALMTTAELAKVLRVETSTVRRWARQGRFPTVRVSERVCRYDYAEVVRSLRGVAGS